MDTVEKVEVVVTDQEKARQERIAARPALSEVLNLHDFEVFLYPYILEHHYMFCLGYRETGYA